MAIAITRRQQQCDCRTCDATNRSSRSAFSESEPGGARLTPDDRTRLGAVLVNEVASAG